METQDILLRLGLSLAIGLMVGIERHWRERNAKPGHRTAGLRTFGLAGLLGGISAAVGTTFPAGSETAAALVIGAVLLVYSAAFIIFQRAESAEEDSFSVTSVVVGIAVFMLGALAVLGDRTVAAAVAVTMTALLASREVLHGLMARMTWQELRSAIIILVMSFVALPLVPRTPVGPFGGVDLAQVWTLAILMAVIAYAGYIAVRWLGERRGLLIAGAVGGLASSTAVTLTYARRSVAGEAAPRALAGGAACAGAVAALRIGGLALTLAPQLALHLAPALAGFALTLAAVGFMLGIGASTIGTPPDAKIANPFDLSVILRFTALIAAASFLVKAGVALVGHDSVVPLAALASLADADAVVLSVTKISAAEAPLRTVATAVAVAIAGDLVAKTGYATILGARAFARAYATAAIAAIVVGATIFFVTPILIGPL